MPGGAGAEVAGLIEARDLTPLAIAGSILVALGLGALHAISPGHGKTVMAAYLVGAGGRARQAVAVGGAIAVMHTASVLALGSLVLSATSLFPPERVYPWLGLTSGLVALALGAGLLVRRLGAWGNRHPGGDPGHVHHHPLAQAHGHGHAGTDGTHGHVHAAPDAPVLSRRGLAALALAGGRLPSPTALVVLLGSIAAHRAGYGLALIAAFSLGLAAALVVVGVLALRARDMVARRMSGSGARLVPVLSAAAIVAMGLVLTLRGVGQL